MLSAGLLIGSAGGATAWADTESGADSSGSGAQSQATEGPSESAALASEPAKSVANPLRTTLQSVTTVLSSLRKLGQPQSTDPKDAQTESSAPSTEDDAEGLGATTADPSSAASDSPAVVSDQNVVASDSPAVAFDENVVASDSTVVPPVTDPLMPLVTVVGPVTNAVATVAYVALTVPGVVAWLPTSPTPVADVITSIQEMLTTVTHAVLPLAQMPTDLFSLLLGMSATTPVATIGGGIGAAASARALATPASLSLEVPPISLVGGLALPASIAPLAPLGDIATTGLSHELPASGIASLAENVIAQSGLGSFLEHAVNALLVPVSLSALAAVALPGIGGLLIICAAGMRIGYRQAKALMEVRRAGIAAFAGPGPLGVVRSGSLIALHPRASRVARPAACRLDQAA